MGGARGDREGLGVPLLSGPADPDPHRDASGGAFPRAALALLTAGSEAVARLDPARAVAWAGVLGRAWARAGGPRVADARVNLRIAFPEWNEARRRRLLEAAMANLARSAAEFLQLARLEREELVERVAVQDLEHFEAARARSPTGGVIVLTAHFGSWELLQAAMAARGFPLAVVHRRRDRAVLDAWVSRLRARAGTQLLGRGMAARAGLRALREGRILAMPYDQNSPRSQGVFVPFLGRLACTRHGPARMAMRSRVPVVPVFVHRVGEGPRHVARFHPALELAPEGEERERAVRENVARMTRAVEAEIREAPDHWVWTHRRWRTAPSGEPHPYGRRRG